MEVGYFLDIVKYFVRKIEMYGMGDYSRLFCKMDINDFCFKEILSFIFCKWNILRYINFLVCDLNLFRIIIVNYFGGGWVGC